MELQLFKKTNDDGVILRYSLLILMSFERYGTVLNLADGGFEGTLVSEPGRFLIELEEGESLAEGEVAVDTLHQRPYLRVIEGIPMDGTVAEVVVSVQNRAGGVQTGTVVLSDADEEEARPITSLAV